MYVRFTCFVGHCKIKSVRLKEESLKYNFPPIFTGYLLVSPFPELTNYYRSTAVDSNKVGTFNVCAVALLQSAVGASNISTLWGKKFAYVLIVC